MADSASQRLRFLSLEVETPDAGAHAARVELQIRPGQSFTGRADCAEPDADHLRCAALATIDALHQAMRPSDGRFELIGVHAVKAFDAIVVIVALLVGRDQAPRRLVGSYLAEEDPTRAAAIAVLNATNRFLGVTTFSS
ncbi:MAG: hypothetical protein O7I93_03220 [Gemmatimonadetes bacterium]|nr:hypothetical protein [Gemmatimonadota bacterium]